MQIYIIEGFNFLIYSLDFLEEKCSYLYAITLMSLPCWMPTRLNIYKGMHVWIVKFLCNYKWQKIKQNVASVHRIG